MRRWIEQLFATTGMADLRRLRTSIPDDQLPQIRSVLSEHAAAVEATDPDRAAFVRRLEEFVADEERRRREHPPVVPLLTSGLPHLDLYGGGLSELIPAYLDADDPAEFLRSHPLLLTPVAARLVMLLAPAGPHARLLVLAEERGVQAAAEALVPGAVRAPHQLHQPFADELERIWRDLPDVDARIQAAQELMRDHSFPDAHRDARAAVEHLLAEGLLVRYEEGGTVADLAQAAIYLRRLHSASRIAETTLPRGESVAYFTLASRRALADWYLAAEADEPVILERAEYWSVRALAAMTTPDLARTVAHLTSGRVLTALYRHHGAPADGAWAVAMLWLAEALAERALDHQEVLDAAGQLMGAARARGDEWLTGAVNRLGRYATQRRMGA